MLLVNAENVVHDFFPACFKHLAATAHLHLVSTWCKVTMQP